MIEVEKKFFPTENALTFIHEKCEFKSEKIVHDVYFDTRDFDMVKNNIWLRERDGRWEMKVATEMFDDSFPTYNEIEDEGEIISRLGIDAGMLSFEVLKQAGYEPIADYTTVRKKYTKDSFTIDIDSTDFGFELIEIELMVYNPDEIDQAKQEIHAFAQSIDPDMRVAELGKMRHYILKNYPQVYQELVELGRFRPVEL